MLYSGRDGMGWHLEGADKKLLYYIKLINHIIKDQKNFLNKNHRFQILNFSTAYPKNDNIH